MEKGNPWEGWCGSHADGIQPWEQLGLEPPERPPRVPPQPPGMRSPPGFPAPEEPIWGFLTGIPVFNWLAQNPSVSLQFPISVGITGKRRKRGTGGAWAQARDRDALSR